MVGSARSGGSDPTRIGPYRLLRRLGAGGMGTVYLGVNRAGQQVAVKLVHPDLARVPAFRDRLEREATSARRVARFCTAAVLDVDVNAETPAAGTDAGTIDLWDLADLAAPVHAATITQVGDWVYSVAFSPDGNVLAAGVGDGAVRLWDVADPARPDALATARFHRDRVRAVAFAPDGATLASGDDGQVGLWAVTDPARPQRRWAADAGTAGIRSVALSPRGGLLALAGDDGTVRRWDLTDAAKPRPTRACAAPPGRCRP